MAIVFDPEGFEIDALLEYAGNLAGKRVLEIGAGDGRLTWRYAEKAAYVTAIDPNGSKIALAKEALPETLRERVTFLPMSLEAFELPPIAVGFDMAIMSWSL